jgi:ComF family protein
MIHSLKYRGVAELADPLARLLAQLLVRDFPGRRWDLVVPVPLHRVRQRERGYNQSALIAQRLAGMLGWPFDGRLIRRTRPTRSQTHLSRAERLVNVTGAFSCADPPRVRGLQVLLIDDVHTTGSTLNETAKALKEAGAAGVFALSATRADL